MVTVAIVGALAAVALPTLAGESRKAEGDAEVGAVFAELRSEQRRRDPPEVEPRSVIGAPWPVQLPVPGVRAALYV